MVHNRPNQKSSLTAADILSIDEFGKAMAAELSRARQSIEGFDINIEAIRQMDKGIGVCYAIGVKHHLWVSVFPHRPDSKHRATVCLARKSIVAKVEGCVLAETSHDSALAIAKEVCRVLKLKSALDIEKIMSGIDPKHNH